MVSIEIPVKPKGVWNILQLYQINFLLPLYRKHPRDCFSWYKTWNILICKFPFLNKNMSELGGGMESLHAYVESLEGVSRVIKVRMTRFRRQPTDTSPYV